MVPEILGSLLHRCATTKNFLLGISLHAAAIKVGEITNVIMCNNILNFYAKCGSMNSAYQLFDKMPHRNIVSWSAVISGYDQSERPQSAILIFSQMQQYFKPNEFIFSSVLSSCAVVKQLKLGQQIHAQIVKLGCGYVSFVLNSLISMYMKCCMCFEALSIFFNDSHSGSLTLVSYNVTITGLLENNLIERALEIYKLMCRHDLIPDHFTFAGLLGTGESTHYDLSLSMQLHCQIAKLGLDCLAFIGNLLIRMYSRLNLVWQSEKVFWSIHDKDNISWNTVMAAFSHYNENLKALRFFREMVMDRNVKADLFTYASVLSAAAGLASLQHGKEIHCHLIRTEPEWDINVGNSLINMYSKSGSMESGQLIFGRMQSRNLVSLNSIIAAYACHGLAEKSITLFEEMVRTGLEPNSITFLALLTACNHSGLASEGEALFNSMSKLYGIAPSSEHLCCLVDLLGRAGRLQEAEAYIQKYPSGNDSVVFGCLLSSCRLHGNIIVGERAATTLLRVPAITTSPYVLLSNMHASHRKWDSAAVARKMLQENGLKKEPACSMVEVKGSVEKFIVGDFSHPKMDEMLNLLKTLSWMVNEELFCY